MFLLKTSLMLRYRYKSCKRRRQNLASMRQLCGQRETIVSIDLRNIVKRMLIVNTYVIDLTNVNASLTSNVFSLSATFVKANIKQKNA